MAERFSFRAPAHVVPGVHPPNLSPRLLPPGRVMTIREFAKRLLSEVSPRHFFSVPPKVRGAIEAPNRVQSHCDLTRTGTCRSIWTLFQEKTSWKFPMWRFDSACQDRSSTGSSCLPTCTIGARSNWDWAPVMESWWKSPFGRGGVGLVPYQHPINLQPGSCLDTVLTSSLDF